MEMLKEKLSNLSGGRILDVATGRGEFLKILQESFKDYTTLTGIDSSERLLDKCRENFPDERVTFCHMDAAKLEFAENSFDTVAISNSLHHMQNLNQVLKEMQRVLRPGGLFIINEMFQDNQTEAQLSHVYFHHWTAESDRLLGNVHNETFRKHEIAEIAFDLNLRSLELFESADLTADPKDPESIGWVEEVFGRVLEKLKDHPDFEMFKAKGEKLVQRVQNIGIIGSTQLIIIGTK